MPQRFRKRESMHRSWPETRSSLLVSGSVCFFTGLLVGMLALIAMSAGPAQAAGPPERTGCHRNAPPIIRDGFPMPQLRYSRNGKLNTSMRAAVGPTRINGERVIAQTYDGQYPGPMLMVCRRDKLTINFTNDLPGPTNFHTHGFHVSPRANHDNVYLNLPPGKKFKYEYRIPDSNRPGAYWYHPRSGTCASVSWSSRTPR